MYCEIKNDMAAICVTDWAADGTDVCADVSIPANVDNCLKNLLRHALMADVVTQGVTHVTFHTYESPIEDEIVSLRLGQLAVRGDTPYAFRICKAAPRDAPLTWVTSDDILDPDKRVVQPPSGRFCIVPLLAGARFDVTCFTQAGTARAHTLFNSVFVSRPADAQFRLETTGALGCAATWNRAIDASIEKMSEFMSSYRPTAAAAET